jgi:hypothetical protein
VEAAGFQDGGPGFISCSLRRFGVRYAVNFDDQFSVESYEIDDVPVD